MKRVQVDFILNILSYFLLVSLGSSGLLLEFVLIPGSRGGRGWGLWGLSRHQWGDIHFYLSLAFIASMILHVILHWAWVKSTFTKYTFNRAFSVLTTVCVLTIVMLVLPFAVPIERGGYEEGEYESTVQGENQSFEGLPGGLHIRGSNTLLEIEAETGIAPEIILKAMNLPDGFPHDARLGRTLREYGKDMEAVRTAVSQILANNQ